MTGVNIQYVEVRTGGWTKNARIMYAPTLPLIENSKNGCILIKCKDFEIS